MTREALDQSLPRDENRSRARPRAFAAGRVELLVSPLSATYAVNCRGTGRRIAQKANSGHLDSILSTSTQLAEKLYTIAFTTSLVAAMPRWEQARNNFPTSYLCATGYASVPMLGRALAEPVAPGKPEKLNREVISDLFLSKSWPWFESGEEGVVHVGP